MQKGLLHRCCFSSCPPPESLKAIRSSAAHGENPVKPFGPNQSPTLHGSSRSMLRLVAWPKWGLAGSAWVAWVAWAWESGKAQRLNDTRRLHRGQRLPSNSSSASSGRPGPTGFSFKSCRELLLVLLISQVSKGDPLSEPSSRTCPSSGSLFIQLLGEEMR